MNQNTDYGIREMRRNWRKCLEVLELSEWQCFELAKVPQKSCFLDLDQYPDLFRLLQTFNLSLDILSSGQICLETLEKQFRSEAAFSKRALGNLGSRPQIILRLGSFLNDSEFKEILASFQLSKELLFKANTYLSAEIVEKLTNRIFEREFSFFWIKKSAEQTCFEAFGHIEKNRKTFLDFVDCGVGPIERNFDYKIERSNLKQIVFSCRENEKTFQYFGRGLRGDSWPSNIKYFVEAYFHGQAEVKILSGVFEGCRNKFEVNFP